MAVNISKEWNWDVINADTVYDTEEFCEFFSNTLDQAVLADIYYQSEGRIEAGLAVDREELLNGFKRYYGIIDGVITGNTEVNETYDGLIVYGNIPESLHENLTEYEELVESRLPSYYKMYIQRQLDEYKNCVRYLDGMKNFLYYVEDENGNVIGGNTSKRRAILSFTVLFEILFCRGMNFMTCGRILALQSRASPSCLRSLLCLCWGFWHV